MLSKEANFSKCKVWLYEDFLEQDSTTGPNFASMLILSCAESCWGVAFPKPCTPSQAPYPSPCLNRQGSLTPLLLLFPTKSWDFVGTLMKNAHVSNPVHWLFYIQILFTSVAFSTFHVLRKWKKSLKIAQQSCHKFLAICAKQRNFEFSANFFR